MYTYTAIQRYIYVHCHATEKSEAIACARSKELPVNPDERVEDTKIIIQKK
jgi:hypothetical protein